MNTSLVWLQRVLAALAVYILADPAAFARNLPPSIASRFMAATALLSAFLPSIVHKLQEVATQDTTTTTTESLNKAGDQQTVSSSHTTITK